MICDRCKCEIAELKEMEPEILIKKVCSYLNLPVGWVLSNSRKKHYVEARHIICDILHNHVQCTLKEIGELLGGRDHTTIINSINKIKEWCFDTDFRNHYIKLHKDIFGHTRFFLYDDNFYKLNTGKSKKYRFYINRIV